MSMHPFFIYTNTINMKQRLKILFIIVITGVSILIFIFIFRRAFLYAPQDEITLPVSIKQFVSEEYQIFVEEEGLSNTEQVKKAEEISPPFYPKTLLIPSIEVNAKIQYVGITRNGNMATPNNFSDVGWFKYGAIPGSIGSAVIAGHVNNGLSFPAVFKDLEDLNIGDDIYIDTNDGEVIYFKVIDKQTYDYKAIVEEVFNQNNGAFLKLITCTGLWIPEHRTHDTRLVVVAARIQ